LRDSFTERGQCFSSIFFRIFSLTCVSNHVPRFNKIMTAKTKNKNWNSVNSLIQLQLIRLSDNPDRSMKNEQFCSQLSIYLGAREIRTRGLSDCVEGSLRHWNHARKYLRLAWAGWRKPWMSASERCKNCGMIYFIHFHQHYLNY
jgi:hypothetical protein